MARPKSNTSQEGPLLAAEPVIILDVISICKEGVKGKERKGVEMSVPGKGYVERRPGDFRGVYNNPGDHVSRVRVLSNPCNFQVRFHSPRHCHDQVLPCD